MLQEIISEVKKLRYEEVRNDSSRLFEFVIRADRTSELCSVLERHFGPPWKPAGENPTQEMNERVLIYGGVRKDQTLYYSKQNNASNYAMLWPWANGILITVKISEAAQKR